MPISSTTTDTVERGLGALLKGIAMDPVFREGMAQARKIALHAASDAWARHHGTEVVVALIQQALSSRRR